MKRLMFAVLATCSLSAVAEVSPLLNTKWGQSGVWQARTPKQSGQPTYPGCTTIAAAQVLNYYRYQNSARSEVSYVLDHSGLTGDDVDGNSLYLDLTKHAYDWNSFSIDDSGTASGLNATAEFIYHVGVSLHAQFGGGQGSSATGKQIENAFRYQWGFNQKSRRSMSIISKSAFGYNDQEWAELIRDELDRGRPVIYMAQQANANAGHAFVIDGYRSDGKVHVNWGWGGYGNGYYDANTLKDPSNRSWNRDAMIFRGLEPEEGYAASLIEKPRSDKEYAWQGAASMIAKASKQLKDYGLTHDELEIKAINQPSMAVLQWEVDYSDGKNIKISADNIDKISVRYGEWNDRSADRVYENQSLPLVINPERDGFKDYDGEYLVFSLFFDSGAAGIVSVAATEDEANTSPSKAASDFVVDGYQWQGNGSLISYNSGSETGYGLTLDEVNIAPSSKLPVIFFQWQLDASDGTKLSITGSEKPVKVTYGPWNNRQLDISKSATLPLQISPSEDNFSTSNGEYYVIKIEFLEPIDQNTTIEAKVVQ